MYELIRNIPIEFLPIIINIVLLILLILFDETINIKLAISIIVIICILLGLDIILATNDCKENRSGSVAIRIFVDSCVLCTLLYVNDKIKKRQEYEK